MNMSVTVLTSSEGVPQVKKFDQAGTKYDIGGKWFTCQSVGFHDLQGLGGLLYHLRQDQFIIPGERNDRPGDLTTCTVRDIPAKDQHAYYQDRAVPVYCFDADKIPVPPGYDWHDVQAMAVQVWADVCATYPHLAGVGCVWTCSGSAGIRDLGMAKFHFWVILTTPLWAHDRRTLAEFHRAHFDYKMYERGRKHFEAGRVCVDFPDPLADQPRVGVILGNTLDWPETPIPAAVEYTAPELSNETSLQGGRILARLCERLANVPVGGAGTYSGRHDAALRIGRTVGGHVGAGDISRADAEAGLWAAVQGFEEPDVRYAAALEALETGITEPLQSADERLAEEWKNAPPIMPVPPGETAPVMPQGMSLTPMPSAMTIEDHARTVAEDDDVGIGELADRLFGMPREERDKTLRALKDYMASTTRAKLNDAIVKRKIEFRTGHTQALYNDQSCQVLGNFVVIGNGGGAKGDVLVYDMRDGTTQSVPAFNTRFCHLPPVTVPAGEKSKDIAATQYWLQADPNCQRYDELGFAPIPDPEWNDLETGKRILNVFKTPNIAVQYDDVSLWLNFIDMQIEDPFDRAHYHNYLARLAQRPYERIGHAMGLVGPHGSGKSTTIEVARYLVDGRWGHSMPRYAAKLIPSKLGDKFNKELDRKLLVYIEEMDKPIGGAGYKEARDRATALKDMITAQVLSVEAKGHDAEPRPAYFNMIAAGNYESLPSFTLEPTERRWMMINMAIGSYEMKSLTGNTDIFERLYGWLNDGGMAKLCGYYRSLTLLPEIGRDAPRTNYLERAITSSRGEFEQAFLELARDNETPGLMGGYADVNVLKRIMGERQISMPQTSRLTKIMGDLGYRRLGRARKGGVCGDSPQIYHNSPGNVPLQLNADLHREDVNYFRTAQGLNPI